MKKIVAYTALPLMALLLLGFGLFEPLKGTWQNPNGQTMCFTKGNQCEWILSSGGRSDTFRITYHYEKTSKTTGILDLGPFNRGYLKGKTLYGIVEWSKKKDSFRYDAEPGKTDKVRPKAMNPDQVQTYQRQ
ncbi:MAG: hypothetical protein LCH58_07080 [Bacteroidetes bacterium]|jgi:hypothetical protein|uniref:hypothetical protein n=1 Tax=Phnomibacter sp. TaxID=2836217 RepID=UPI002FDDF7C2|nr:hypothetical protein [Bacteroidota bacterium]